MEIDDLISLVKHKWLLSGSSPNTVKVSNKQLDMLESTYGIVLPNDLRAFFQAVNGMNGTETDDDVIRFWSLDEFKPLTEYEASSEDYIQGPDSLFVFADYSICSHTYAIRLLPETIMYNDIYVLGLVKPILLAKSFSEFLSLYVDGKVLDFLRQY